jgi:hypothetical protein
VIAARGEQAVADRGSEHPLLEVVLVEAALFVDQQVLDEIGGADPRDRPGWARPIQRDRVRIGRSWQRPQRVLDGEIEEGQ